MENNTKRYIMIIHEAIMLISFVVAVGLMLVPQEFSSPTVQTLLKIDSLVIAIALAFCFIYVFHGYKKKDANMYKAFMALYLIEIIYFLITSIIGKYSSFVTVALNVVCIFMAFALAVGKNLGRSLASKIVIILILCRLALFVLYVIKDQYAIYMLNHSLIATVAGLLVLGKYQDKDDRHVKEEE